MEIILIAALSIFVWWLARYWKDRNGILWGILTLALAGLLTPFYMMGSRVLFMGGALMIGCVVVAVIAFLPATKVCPFCKRRINEEAVVCSHCRSDLVGPQAKTSL